MTGNDLKSADRRLLDTIQTDPYAFHIRHDVEQLKLDRQEMRLLPALSR